jgi:hypothetical protein
MTEKPKKPPTVPVYYFTYPEDVEGLLPNGKPYTCGMFVIEYVVPAMPRETSEQIQIVREVVSIFDDLKAGDRWAFVAPQMQAITDALNSIPVVSGRPPPGAIYTQVYVKCLAFYDAILGAKTKKPKDWDAANEAASDDAAEAAESEAAQ